MSPISRRTAAAIIHTPGDSGGAAGFPVNADNIAASTDRTVGTVVARAFTTAVGTGAGTVDACGIATVAAGATVVLIAVVGSAAWVSGYATVRSEPFDTVEEESDVVLATEVEGRLSFAVRCEIRVESLPGDTVADGVARPWSVLEPTGLPFRSVAVAIPVSLILAQRAPTGLEPDPVGPDPPLVAAGDELAPLVEPSSAWASAAPLANTAPMPRVIAPAPSHAYGSR
jgi:hypothetical protein